MKEAKHKMGTSPTILYSTLIKVMSTIALKGEPIRMSVYTYGPYLKPKVFMAGAGNREKMPATTT